MKNVELYEAIGRLIRNSREQRRITQAELAKEVGLSRASITNIELGRQSLLIDQVYRIASALAITPADLLPTNMPKAEAGRSENLSPDVAAWIERARRAIA